MHRSVALDCELFLVQSAGFNCGLCLCVILKLHVQNALWGSDAACPNDKMTGERFVRASHDSHCHAEKFCAEGAEAHHWTMLQALLATAELDADSVWLLLHMQLGTTSSHITPDTKCVPDSQQLLGPSHVLAHRLLSMTSWSLL